jgi:hypothetical protein
MRTFIDVTVKDGEKAPAYCADCQMDEPAQHRTICVDCLHEMRIRNQRKGAREVGVDAL